MVSKKDIMYEIFCFKNNAENKTGRLFTDLFLSFKIYLYEVSSSKSVVLHLSIQKKKKKHEISDCSSRNMINFNFFKKGLGLLFLSHFVHEFSRKVFLVLYFLKWPNFAVWLPVLLEISGMFILIVCYPVCDVMNLEI